MEDRFGLSVPFRQYGCCALRLWKTPWTISVGKQSVLFLAALLRQLP